MRLGKRDTQAPPAPAARLGIRNMPTLALLRQGRERARRSGAIGGADRVRWAQAHAASPVCAVPARRQRRSAGG
ncbi:hypothetical protein [Xanthomonas theicola]|uniref:hypothetical protein n=1 Tax=Xanthomonas theicola TaxID=56464 RepID=UPI0026C5701A